MPKFITPKPDIPSELRDYLKIQDMSDFPIDSYFITQNMKAIAEDIKNIKEKSDII